MCAISRNFCFNNNNNKFIHYYICNKNFVKLHNWGNISLEIRGLCLMKCPSETLQNLPYFKYDLALPQKQLVFRVNWSYFFKACFLPMEASNINDNLERNLSSTNEKNPKLSKTAPNWKFKPCKKVLAKKVDITAVNFPYAMVLLKTSEKQKSYFQSLLRWHEN